MIKESLLLIPEKVRKILLIVFSALFCVGIVGLFLLGITQAQLSGALVAVLAVVSAISALIALIIKWINGK